MRVHVEERVEELAWTNYRSDLQRQYQKHDLLEKLDGNERVRVWLPALRLFALFGIGVLVALVPDFTLNPTP